MMVSIRAPRAGGDCACGAHIKRRRTVSIRAPRAGGDARSSPTRTTWSRFNPRPPCGGRLGGGEAGNVAWWFQSAPPVRGATVVVLATSAPESKFQSAPPVRGATSRVVSRAPTGTRCFNPRPPCGGRHPDIRPIHRPRARVSIRAPRAGGDPSGSFRQSPADSSFNPRPPCGGRPSAAEHDPVSHWFQSAPPVRGATPAERPERALRPDVSIRAPRAGGDRGQRAAGPGHRVSIRAPRAGGDGVAANVRTH